LATIIIVAKTYYFYLSMFANMSYIISSSFEDEELKLFHIELKLSHVKLDLWVEAEAMNSK
jgi:hypothetical protein